VDVLGEVLEIIGQFGCEYTPYRMFVYQLILIGRHNKEPRKDHLDLYVLSMSVRSVHISKSCFEVL
jgi:hypothetical protein